MGYIPELWSKDAEDTWNFVIRAIVSDLRLSCWDSRYCFYNKTTFCSLGMAFVGMQPARNSVSLTAMLIEMKGGPCEFLRDPHTGSLPQDMPSLWPVCFGRRKCKGYEHKLHSYLGEGFAGNWGLGKYRHYLWAMRNTWITDQHALVFLSNYEGTTGSICRL